MSDDTITILGISKANVLMFPETPTNPTMTVTPPLGALIKVQKNVVNTDKNKATLQEFFNARKIIVMDDFEYKVTESNAPIDGVANMVRHYEITGMKPERTLNYSMAPEGFSRMFEDLNKRLKSIAEGKSRLSKEKAKESKAPKIVPSIYFDEADIEEMEKNNAPKKAAPAPQKEPDTSSTTQAAATTKQADSKKAS